MNAITRAALVDAAVDLNKVLGLDPGVDVKAGVKELRSQIVEAASLLKGDGTPKYPDKTPDLTDETRDVLAALGDGSGEAQADAKGAAAAKPPKTPRPPKLGKFSPVKRDTNLGKIVAAALDVSEPTVAKVALASGVDLEKVVSTLKSARMSNGIDHVVEPSGTLTISLPEGVDAESVWHKPKEARAKPASTGGGTKARYDDADVIKLLVDKNPKKPGSAAHGLFELYKDGMTCGQFLKAGGTRACFSWDSTHGFIKIEKKVAKAA